MSSSQEGCIWAMKDCIGGWKKDAKDPCANCLISREKQKCAFATVGCLSGLKNKAKDPTELCYDCTIKHPIPLLKSIFEELNKQVELGILPVEDAEDQKKVLKEGMDAYLRGKKKQREDKGAYLCFSQDPTLQGRDDVDPPIKAWYGDRHFDFEGATSEEDCVWLSGKPGICKRCKLAWLQLNPELIKNDIKDVYMFERVRD